MKSRKLAKTTRLRLDIEKRMCRKKIDMADEYGRKAVRLTTDKLRKIAALNDMKWNKRLNIINKQWDNKLVLNRGSALKQLKKLGVKLDKKWSAKLTEQKNKLTAEAETVQSS